MNSMANLEETDEWKMFSVDFCFIVPLANFMLKKLLVQLMTFRTYEKWPENKQKIGATSDFTGFRLQTPNKLRSLETILRKVLILLVLNSSWKK